MATNPTPIPIPTHPVPPGIDIGTYCRRIRLLHTTRMYAVSEDSTSAVISAWEGLPKAHIATTTTTNETTATTTMWAGAVMLHCGAMRRSRGGILEKESLEGTGWRAGDIEEDGGTRIGTPAVHDDDDRHTPLGFDGRLEGATNVLRTMILRPLPRPPPPASPNINISVPCTMDLPQPPYTGEFPIIWVGDYVPAVCEDPRCPGRRGSLPYSEFRPLPLPPHFHPHGLEITTPVSDIGESSSEVHFSF